jgi:hypothetical protein
MLRRWTTTLVSIALLPVLGSAAHASQRIWFEGETSAGRRITFGVVKRDSGRWFLRTYKVGVETVCEDGTTESFRLSTRFAAYEDVRVDGGRPFEYEDTSVPLTFRQHFEHVDGTLGWRTGSGTFEYNLGGLTDDGQDPQLCGSGDLTWTVERRPARRGGAVTLEFRSGWFPIATSHG